MNRRFLFIIGLALLVVFLIEWNAPSKFSWKATYSHRDEQPFGCAVMDTLLSRSLTGGYSVTHRTLPQMAAEKANVKRVIMVQTPGFSPSQTDMRAINRLLAKGNKLLIVTYKFNYDSVPPDWNVSIYGNDNFNPRLMQRTIQERQVPMSKLRWAKQKPYAEYASSIYSYFVEGYIQIHKAREIDTLLTRVNYIDETVSDTVTSEGVYVEPAKEEGVVNSPVEEALPLIVSMKKNGSEVFLCSSPLLFTNYGMLDNKIRPIIFRLFSQFGNMPVVRTEAYLPKDAINQETPLVYFLQQPPLRWAIYTALIGLIIFFVFTARRRQRIIPVVKDPENKSLEFVKLIGTLYHQRHDNRDLLEKKYIFFCETVRRQFMIDVDDTERRADIAERLSKRIGKPKEEIAGTLQQITALLAQKSKISDSEMRTVIDALDDMLNES